MVALAVAVPVAGAIVEVVTFAGASAAVVAVVANARSMSETKCVCSARWSVLFARRCAYVHLFADLRGISSSARLRGPSKLVRSHSPELVQFCLLLLSIRCCFVESLQLFVWSLLGRVQVWATFRPDLSCYSPLHNAFSTHRFLSAEFQPKFLYLLHISVFPLEESLFSIASLRISSVPPVPLPPRLLLLLLLGLSILLPSPVAFPLYLLLLCIACPRVTPVDHFVLGLFLVLLPASSLQIPAALFHGSFVLFLCPARCSSVLLPCHVIRGVTRLRCFSDLWCRSLVLLLVVLLLHISCQIGFKIRILS